MDRQIPRSLGTHNGGFHADEVTACALLLLFNQIDKDKIIRTRDPEKLNQCEYVCDVGGVFDPSRKKFDHHQAEYKGHLSSAGMILNYLKDQKIISEKEFNLLQNNLIYGVDAHDNGIEVAPQGVATYSSIVGNFAPIQHESTEEEWNQTFHLALDFALSHLKRLYARYKHIESYREKVKAEMDKNGEVLVFDEPLPWMDSFFDMGGENHPAKFVIMPTGSHWKLRGIPPNLEHRMKVRSPLPEKWAGLLSEDLKKVSGIDGAIFCHKGRFFSVWETKADAEKALKLTLESK